MYTYSAYESIPSEERMAMIIVFSMLAIYGLFFAYAILNYIFTALSLQRIATRRAIPCPWLAWIPYANCWLVGSIAREYDNRQGINRRWDKANLFSYILFVEGFPIIYFLMYFATFFVAAIGANTDDETTAMITILIMLLTIIAMIFVFALLASVFSLINNICYYKIFESTVPEKALKYMLISLIVPFGNLVCLWKCSKCGYDVVTDKMAEPIIEI
jgi:hypothetical protein